MKVLIAIDDSEHAQRAWQYYLDNLHQADSEVVLCHIMELSSQYVTAGLPVEIMHEMMRDIQRDADKFVHKYVKQCTDKHIKHKLLMAFDHPGEFLVKAAKEEHANLIVLGTRGMGAVRRTILGSVSDYVVHHAHCPVMICRH